MIICVRKVLRANTIVLYWSKVWKPVLVFSGMPGPVTPEVKAGLQIYACQCGHVRRDTLC